MPAGDAAPDVLVRRTGLVGSRPERLPGTGATRHVRLHTVGGVTTTHTITLRVTGGAGNTAEDHVHVTIEEIF